MFRTDSTTQQRKVCTVSAEEFMRRYGETEPSELHVGRRFASDDCSRRRSTRLARTFPWRVHQPPLCAHGLVASKNQGQPQASLPLSLPPSLAKWPHRPQRSASPTLRHFLRSAHFCQSTFSDFILSARFWRILSLSSGVTGTASWGGSHRAMLSR